MSSVSRNKTEQGRAVSRKPFILVVYRGSTYACVRIHVHLLTRGITQEMYITVHVDKNTLHLPFKIKDNALNIKLNFNLKLQV